jgi:hypothetical protein
MISFSFVVSPVLINLGYKLVDRFTTEPKPDLPLKALSESIHDHVIVVGYSYVGRVICVILEQANIPYIAFERSLDRLAVAKKGKHKVPLWRRHRPGHDGCVGDLARPRRDRDDERLFRNQTDDWHSATVLSERKSHDCRALSVSTGRVAEDGSNAGNRPYA